MIEKEEKLYEYIHYEKDRRIAYVTIDRPEVLNAISPPTKAELNSVFADFVADEDLWVAIITGAGERSFCAGADLKYRVNEEDEHELRNPGTRQPWALDECLKPVIAAVNGYAVGGDWRWRCAATSSSRRSTLGSDCQSRRGGYSLIPVAFSNCHDAYRTTWRWNSSSRANWCLHRKHIAWV